MTRLGRGLVAVALGASALIGAAPVAHACDPNSTCNNRVACVVQTVVFFDGEADDFVRAVAGCLVRV